MARKKKLIFIILISGIFTYLIYFFNKENRIDLVALGDGISSGETAFLIDGISYNDYLKEYYEKRNILKKYDNTYSYKNNTIKDLINMIDDNDNKKDSLNIKQTIHNAKIITIGIGEEELVKASITKDLNIDYIKKLIREYDKLLDNIKRISEGKIILVGFYENKYLDKSNIIILNSELSNLANKYDCYYININDLLSEKKYFVSESSYYFNYLAHQKIANMIINSI